MYDTDMVNQGPVFTFPEDYFRITTLKGAVLLGYLFHLDNMARAAADYPGYIMFSVEDFATHLRVKERSKQRRMLDTLENAGLITTFGGYRNTRKIRMNYDEIDKKIAELPQK